MDVTAMLCNYAEVQNNLLYVMGAGIDRTFVPPGAPQPYVVNIAVAIQVTVPWEATNQEHTLELDILDADEHPVQVPVSPTAFDAVHVEAKFNVGRPPTLEIQESQLVQLAINMPGLPFPSVGAYSIKISIDGTELHRLRYKVVSPPGMVAQGGIDPASIGSF